MKTSFNIFDASKPNPSSIYFLWEKYCINISIVKTAMEAPKFVHESFVLWAAGTQERDAEGNVVTVIDTRKCDEKLRKGENRRRCLLKHRKIRQKKIARTSFNCCLKDFSMGNFNENCKTHKFLCSVKYFVCILGNEIPIHQFIY